MGSSTAVSLSDDERRLLERAYSVQNTHRPQDGNVNVYYDRATGVIYGMGQRPDREAVIVRLRCDEVGILPIMWEPRGVRETTLLTPALERVVQVVREYRVELKRTIDPNLVKQRRQIMGLE